MSLEYTIVVIAVSLAYAIIQKFLPDFPVSPEVFQVVILYLLAKLGVEVIGKPLATRVRMLFVRNVKPSIRK